MTCSSCQHAFDVAGIPSFEEIVCPACHTPQLVPARLGAFLLVELLGKGGMGAVYRGKDIALGRLVAVKVLLKSLGSNPEFVATFRNEAKAAAALNHPNIVQIYSFGMEHGQPYMVMELLEGGRVDQMMSLGEMMNETQAFKIVLETAEGLSAAAGIGLVHGDVKPENILMDGNGVAKVVDFGLAQFKKKAEAGATSQGIWGTPYYIAPEKVRGHQGDAKSDIYSLGATLFHMLTLKPPFDGETPIAVVKARLAAPAPDVRTIRPDVDPEVAAIVARMLEKESARRYPTYASLLSDMHKVFLKLKPIPVQAAPAALSKRDGKIVLTKKKAVITVGQQQTTGPLTVVSGAIEEPISLDEEPVSQTLWTKHKKLILIASSVVVLLSLIGGVTAWVKKANADKARLTAEQTDAVRLEEIKTQANKIWSDIYTLMIKSAKRTEFVRAWVKEAEALFASMASETNNLLDEAVINEVAVKVPPMVADVKKLATESVAQALAEVRGVTNSLNIGREAIYQSTNSAQAEAILLTLTNLPGLSQAKYAALEAEVSRGETALKALAEMDKRIADLARVQKAEKAKLEKERLAAEKKQKAEEAKRRQQEAIEKKAPAEMALIQKTRKSNAALMQKNQFKQAFEAMSAIGTGIKSTQGMAEHAAAVERYQMMMELKAFIIEGIRNDFKKHPESGFRYGWLVNGVPSRDVLGADENNVMVRGGPVPWTDVSPAQIIRFITEYKGAGGVAKPEAGRPLLGAAAYVLEAGAGSKSSKKLASELANEAVSVAPELGAKAKSVLPELF